MKNTAIVTWTTYRNFGTCLQAYALQKAVQSLGYSSRIIDDAAIVAAYRKKRWSPLRTLRSIPWLYPKRTEFVRKNRQAELEYDIFRSKHMAIDHEWTYPEDLTGRYDAYIAGSDQIWSPNVRFDGFYYLDFTDRQKIAYAPSFGTADYPEDKAALVKPLLESFSALSVREEAGAEILRDKFSLDAKVVADPTMLLTKEDWENLLQKPLTHKDGKPYLLCYLLTYNKVYVDFVRKYCSDNGLDLKLLVVSPELVGIAEDEVYAGPLGFLEAVRGAETVMTDSFHGTIFSLLFQKDFHTFKRFKDGTSSSQNSRLENLLGKMGLTDRYISESSLRLSDRPIDYKEVGERVSQMRNDSLDYLREALGKDYTRNQTAYVAYAKSVQERHEAASGGAASMIAKAFVEAGGVIYGCSQEAGVQIRHVRVENVEGIASLAGSKYVLSNTESVFAQVKDDLAAGRKVLFIGLPCQIAGIKKYVGATKEGLYTADLCCHGTPSQSLLREHIDSVGLSSVADKVVFRTKEASGVKYVFRVYDINGECVYDKPARKDWYMTGFMSGLFLRECCYSCPYAKRERGADLTLADHWAMGRSSNPEMILSKGLSTILINTSKGKELFQMASQYLAYEERPLKEAFRNGRFIRPSEKPADHDSFVQDMKEHGYAHACRKFLPAHMRRMFINELKSRYYKSQLRQSIRKLLRK